MNVLKRIWLWLRFGDRIHRTVDTINGIVCESEVIGRGNKVIGYWAYGSYDPAYPYQGDEDRKCDRAGS